jgi:GH43 family beta-xylosidase
MTRLNTLINRTAVKRLRLAVNIILLLPLLALLTFVHGQDSAMQPGTLTNPLNVNNGADPWLTYYEGNYYLATTTGASNWIMRMSPTLAGLKTAEPVQIYLETDPARCCNFWAPEFHLLDGPNGLHWYFYYTAGTADTLDNQHSHVLESVGTDPMGPYTYKGRLLDSNNTWSIDGSILAINDSLYFLSSAFYNDIQSMFIAPMSNPWTLSGERVLLSTPEYDWEMSGVPVNEGPVALFHDDDLFIIYSASNCWTPDYKLGMLTYNGGDPLNIDSWIKNPEPVFERSDENGVFGPGHNGFFRSPDGTEDWIVYHANTSASGGCDSGRTTRVQEFTWNEDGTPNFGVPAPTGVAIDAPSGDTGVDPMPELTAIETTRLRSFAIEGSYLYHVNTYLRMDFGMNPVEDSQFFLVPGLADVAAVSIESFNQAGYFIRHQDNSLVMSANDSTEAFRVESTWWIRPGLADESMISLESYDQPGYYIGQMFGVLALVEITDASTQRVREDATFIEEH